MPGNILLLQGPVGPFFRRLAEDLQAEGRTVYKVNFNGGDEFFYRGRDAIPYRGRLETWPAFIERLLAKRSIERLYLFGDGRAYHMCAHEVAKRLGVAVYVFEEGYLRPDYITLEQEGVNGFSLLPRDPRKYGDMSTAEPDAPVSIGHSFVWAAVYAMAYYIASSISNKYPHYQHHRPLNVWREGRKWVLSGLRKLWFSFADRATMGRLTNELADRYVLVPLQVHCDIQVVHHSRFDSVEQFIAQVMASFAHSAPAENYLVFKHHPMDRGYRNYSRFIKREARAKGVGGRVLYVHDLPLPTLFKHARGTVVINSTVGLSSIFHGTPVKVLGEAIYDMPGLTSQVPLDDFWHTAQGPDRDLYRRFSNYLIANTQLNGNFYKRLPGTANALGVIWPEVTRDFMPTNAPSGPALPLQQMNSSLEGFAQETSS